MILDKSSADLMQDIAWLLLNTKNTFLYPDQKERWNAIAKAWRKENEVYGYFIPDHLGSYL